MRRRHTVVELIPPKKFLQELDGRARVLNCQNDVQLIVAEGNGSRGLLALPSGDAPPLRFRVHKLQISNVIEKRKKRENKNKQTKIKGIYPRQTLWGSAGSPEALAQYLAKLQCISWLAGSHD